MINGDPELDLIVRRYSADAPTIIRTITMIATIDFEIAFLENLVCCKETLYSYMSNTVLISRMQLIFVAS